MEVPIDIRSDVLKWAPLAIDAPRQLLHRQRVDGKAVLHSLADHPDQWKFREAAFFLWMLVFSDPLQVPL